MPLPIKKIYISSRYKTDSSVSSSNFKVELSQTLSMPNNCIFWVDDICIPVSWYTIETGFND